jgi:flagellar motor switch protein FliM
MSPSATPADVPLPVGELPPGESAPPPLPISASEATVTVVTTQGYREQRKSASVRKHDFRQSGFLAPSELRWIRLRHEQFVRALAARLSIVLRMDVTEHLSRLHILNYQQLIDGFSHPIHISLFKAEPLKGVCMLVIPPRLGLTIVDRLLGGPGQPIEAERDLSEIETALLDQTVQIILTEWCNHWQDVQEIKPSLLGHENNCRFLQTAPADTPMLQVILDTGLGQEVQPMQLVFPYSTIKTFVRHMNPAGLPYSDGGAAGVREKWNPELNAVKIDLTAAWEGPKLSALEISRLKLGDMLMMSPQDAERVQIRLAGVPRFCGRLGTCGRKWAVELTSVLSS